MAGFSTYPRTAAELRALLSLGLDEVRRLLRARSLRVNLRGFLSFLFKEKRYGESDLDRFNARLLQWQTEREAKGLRDSTLVYHHSGVRNLHGFRVEKIDYQKKADRTVYVRERSQFNILRKEWIKMIGVEKAKELAAAGIPPNDIKRMADEGKTPLGYQVHHRIPLDDGGKNEPSNYILIRDDIEHRAVHGYYNPGELRIDRLAPGERAEVALPIPPADTVIYPNPARGYVAETVPNVEMLEVYDEH